jgi:hypothetical protein
MGDNGDDNNNNGDEEAEDESAVSEAHEASTGWREARDLEARRDLRARVLSATATALLTPHTPMTTTATTMTTTATTTVTARKATSAATATAAVTSTGVSMVCDVLVLTTIALGPAVTQSSGASEELGLASACLKILLHTSRASVEVQTKMKK